MNRGGDTETFLRLVAIELRRVAERAPSVADTLRHIAQQLEAEANALGGRAG